MKKNNLAIPISIVIAAVFISGALFFTRKNTNPSGPASVASAGQTVASQHPENLMKPISSSDHILGNPNAPVVLVEYSDTECPFCKKFQPEIKQIMDQYGPSGKVAWVYRHFPIVQLHSKAPKEAEATECVNELAGNLKFWDFINKIYEITPANDGLDASQLPDIAESVGVDRTAFSKCLSSGKYASKVAESVDDAITAGGQGTPYTIIVTKGAKYPITQGAIPYATLKSIIDTLLTPAA